MSKQLFSWSEAQYSRFLAQRNLAIKDLIFRLKGVISGTDSKDLGADLNATSNANTNNLSQITRILDLGCGGGNSTAFLREAFTEAHIVGIDSSSNMIAKAQKLGLKNCEFILHNVNEGLAEFKNFDVVFANASIHWIANQHKLFSDIFSALGVQQKRKDSKKNNILSAESNTPKFLAIQIPLDSKSIFHNELQALAKSPKWSEYFPNPRAFASLSLIQYYEILAPIAQNVWLWECEYVHILDSTQSVIEWYKGSGLRPYLEVLSEVKSAEFEKALLQRLDSRILNASNGAVLMQMPRLFFIAKF